ncbi:MAG: FtsX-like permease family protein, partial [Bacteroidales bacterium]|nr:FtsX-like permease family protein [Bacteroidales bacterium]
MKAYFKFLSRNMLYTLIEVFGLAIALTFILIIGKYTKTELNIDKFHENADNIYTLATEDFLASAYGLPSYLLSRYPEIEQTCAYMKTGTFRVDVYDNSYDVETAVFDTTFLSMFSFPLVEGDREKAFSTIDKVLISEELSNKIFRGNSAVDKTITLNWGDEKTVFVVGGVFKKIENSIIPNYDLIFNIQLVEKHINGNITNISLDNAAGVTLFIQTKPGTDLTAKTDDMLNYFKEFYWIYKMEAREEVHIIPLTEVYFGKIPSAQGHLQQVDKQFVFILSGVALFILLFALINYINLTVAQTGFRAKEMAMRRLLGSSKTAVILRFIVEAITMTVIAFFISLLLAELVCPFTETLLARDISLFANITSGEIIICIALILVIGVLAGLIPAVMISRYKPIDVVKGTFRLQSKMVLGKVFVVIQNVVTITMLALTLALFLQIQHLINRPLGYKTENIMNVDIPSQFSALHDNDSTNTTLNMLIDELEQIPYVKRVGFSQGHPIGHFNNSTFKRYDDIISLMMIGLDTTAFNIMGFEMINQNAEPLHESFWLTESAMRKLNCDNNVTELLMRPEQNWNIKVAGIIKDFIPLNMPVDNSTTIALITIDKDPWNLIIETTDNHIAAEAAIKEKMESITQCEFDGWFFSDRVTEKYSD